MKCDGVTRRKETGGEKERGDQRQTTVDTTSFLYMSEMVIGFHAEE